MFTKRIAALALWCAAATAAAVELNTANVAELDGIKGIGPGLSGRILDERKRGDFQDWNDFIGRVSGVGEKSAARFSKEGLTVNGKKFRPAAASPSHATHLERGSDPAAQ